MSPRDTTTGRFVEGAEQTARVPQARCTPAQLAAWRAAAALAGLSMSDWMRQTLDRAAPRPGEPLLQYAQRMETSYLLRVRRVGMMLTPDRWTKRLRATGG